MSTGKLEKLRYVLFEVADTTSEDARSATSLSMSMRTRA
jgi:hypothetical protein